MHEAARVQRRDRDHERARQRSDAAGPHLRRAQRRRVDQLHDQERRSVVARAVAEQRGRQRRPDRGEHIALAGEPVPRLAVRMGELDRDATIAAARAHDDAEPAPAQDGLDRIPREPVHVRTPVATRATRRCSTRAPDRRR